MPFLKLYVKKAKGFENIPKQGPVIIIANHSSYIDGVLLRYLTGRMPRAIQSREWLGRGIFRKFIFLTVLKQIPTNGSISKALAALVHGEALQLFPEGGRSADGKIQKCEHTGLGVMASSTGCPVVPMGIKGSFEWWPRQKTFPRLFSFRSITMKAGKPMFYSGANDKKGYLAFQSRAMKQVAKLTK
jgi:1-acyl-sn-glycerol-3-phosphate acyltransferase